MVGGYFDRVGDVKRNGIARLNSDGSLDASFGEGVEGIPSGWFRGVLAMVMEGDGKVIVGGDFATVNNGPRRSIARLDASSNPGDINVEQPVGAALIDGGAGAGFGNAEVGGSSVRTFKITNQGAAPLTLGPFVKDGVSAAEFTLNTTETSLLLAPGASTSFDVVFTPFSAGAKSAALHIGSNDGTRAPSTSRSLPPVRRRGRPGSGLKCSRRCPAPRLGRAW